VTQQQLEIYLRKIKRCKDFKYTIGNRKIGKDTLIFNMSTARKCPAAKLGLCQLDDPDQCYALKAEKFYPQSYPFRQCQARYWRNNTAETIARAIRAALKNHKKVKYIRVNEAGDMTSAACLEKIMQISAYVRGVVFYMYTARRDLVTKKALAIKPPNLIINGSGFMADNAFIIDGKTKYKCKMDCTTCTLCKTNGHKTISVKKH